MAFNYEEFQKKLVEYKVYDAWIYTVNLVKMLSYVEVSYILINRTVEKRSEKIKETLNTQFSQVVSEKIVKVSDNDLNNGYIDILNLNINEAMFLEKLITEFFHYSRVSFDILFQVINAALLSKENIVMDDGNIISFVSKKVTGAVKEAIDNNKNNPIYDYIRAYDNYTKHYKTVLTQSKLALGVDFANQVVIDSFVYKQHTYPSKNALQFVKEAYEYVLKTIEDILMEIEKSLKEDLVDKSRIQEIEFEFVTNVSDGEDSIYYLSFFVDVDECVDKLPEEIKVLPVKITSSGKVYTFDFRFKKIFLRKKGSNKIIGCANLKNGFDTNEIYRIYEVQQCDSDDCIEDYVLYQKNFVKEYPKYNINWGAMEGKFVIIKD